MMRPTERAIVVLFWIIVEKLEPSRNRNFSLRTCYSIINEASNLASTTKDTSICREWPWMAMEYAVQKASFCRPGVRLADFERWIDARGMVASSSLLMAVLRRWAL
jgi:hypothetical protein